MTAHHPPSDPAEPDDAERDALAAAFVMDVLGPDEQATATRRLVTDPVFAARVARFRHDRETGATDAVPSGETWQKIARRIGDGQMERGAVVSRLFGWLRAVRGCFTRPRPR